MALAKFFEDIVESYLEGVDARLNASSRSARDSEWTTKKATVSDAVVLRGSDGILWDDHLVFRTGDRIAFETVPASKGMTVDLRWQDARKGPAPDLRRRDAVTEIVSACATSGDLVARCGNYEKVYRISFVVESQPEALPDFAAELAALTAHPPSWDQSSFDRFREATEIVLQAHRLPADFCDGIREYHLGLYHEQIREGRFGKRLERAYAQLAPFVPHSRLAALISGYHLYRINAFDHPLVMAFQRIGRVARFFSGAAAPKGLRRSATTRNTPGNLIISALDEAVISAVENLDRDRLVLAAADVERAAASCCPVDTQGLERLHFLRFEIHQRRGDLRGAAQHAAALCNSSVPRFRSLVKQAPSSTVATSP